MTLYCWKRKLHKAISHTIQLLKTLHFRYLFGARMSWQYAIFCRVQPSFFLVLRTVAEHTEIPYFSSFFWICLLVISSFFCICWSMKAFASSDSFLGLPECGKFAMEPVICSFLMIRVTLARLALKPSFFKDWGETLFVKDLDSSSCIIWYFWHDLFECLKANEHETCCLFYDTQSVAMVAIITNPCRD